MRSGLVVTGLQCLLDRPTEYVTGLAVPGARVCAPGTNVKRSRFNFVPAAALRFGFGLAVKVSGRDVEAAVGLAVKSHDALDDHAPALRRLELSADADAPVFATLVDGEVLGEGARHVTVADTPRHLLRSDRRRSPGCSASAFGGRGDLGAATST